MKRLSLMLLSVLIVVGLMASVGYAQGAEKFALNLINPAEGEENAEGWVIINFTPKGNVDAVVQIKVSGLLPETEYVYKTKGVTYSTFTTNKVGKATCHYNFSEEENLLGGAINIRAASDNHRVLRYVL